MSRSDLVTTEQARQILNYANGTSVTRLVAQGVLKPALKGEGVRGPFWFRRRDVERLAAKLAGRAA